jgi:hypothetical protein
VIRKKILQKGIIQIPVIIGLLIIGLALPAALKLTQDTQETRGGASNYLWRCSLNIGCDSSSPACRSGCTSSTPIEGYFENNQSWCTKQSDGSYGGYVCEAVDSSSVTPTVTLSPATPILSITPSNPPTITLTLTPVLTSTPGPAPDCISPGYECGYGENPPPCCNDYGCVDNFCVSPTPFQCEDGNKYCTTTNIAYNCLGGQWFQKNCSTFEEECRIVDDRAECVSISVSPTVTPTPGSECVNHSCNWCAPKGQCEASGGIWQTECNDYCAGDNRCCYLPGSGGQGHGETHCDLDQLSWNTSEMEGQINVGEEMIFKGQINVPGYFALKDVFKVCVYNQGSSSPLVCNDSRDDLSYQPDNPGQKDMGGVVGFELSWTPQQAGQLSLYPSFSANYYNPGSEGDLSPVWTCPRESTVLSLSVVDVPSPTPNPNCHSNRSCSFNDWLDAYTTLGGFGRSTLSEANPSDINCDLKVDLIDFNLQQHGCLSAPGVPR